MGARERVVRIKSLNATEYAAGSEVYVPMDNVVGAPAVVGDGRIGHFTRIYLRLRATFITAIGVNGQPGALCAAIAQNIRVRAAATDLIDGGQMDGEDFNAIATEVARAAVVSPVSALVNVVNAAYDAGDIWVCIPLAKPSRDRFSRCGDGAIPVAAFDRRLDAEHGLRFKLAAAGDRCKAFASATLGAFTAVDVFGVYRTDTDPQVILPGFRAYTEAQASFDLDPIGGAGGTHELLSIFDPPVAATGARAYTSYSNLSARLGADQLYTGENFTTLTDMFNLVDWVYPGGVDWRNRLTPSSSLPLIQRRADNPVLEDAYGRLSINIGTRPGASQRLLQAGRRVYSSEVAARINASLGGGYTSRRSTPASLNEAATANRAALVLDQKLSK